MQKPQDAWERPSSDVKNYGRLNRPGESVLYVSRETTNAIYETGCQVGDYFFLLIYVNKKSMRIAQVHNVKYMNDLTEEENAKRIIMHSFLLSEFAKFVPPNREFLYKSSIIIYEEFFLNSQIDGFSYPSVSSPVNRGFNLSFTKEKARENLKFIGVMVCQLMPPNEGSEFIIRPILDGFLNERDDFTFYPYNSNVSREKFGRFILRRDMGL
jgi:hypothetical protein